MKIWNYILTTLLCWSSFAQAQDLTKILKEMRNEYSQSSSLEISMEILVYDSAQSEPYFRQTADIKRDGNKYWYQMEENEMLLNDNYLIMLDRNTQQISLSKRDPQSEKELQKSFQFNLDSILASYETFQYLGVEDSTEHYVAVEKQGPIKEVHFFFMPESHGLSEIAYQYREGQYVSIRFIVFNKNVLFGPDTFSESRYVTKVNNKMVPIRDFEEYAMHAQ